jgi:hypothetical protein
MSVFVAALVLATFVGFPILVLLEQRVVTSAWMACVAGFLLGAATAALMFFPAPESPSLLPGWSGFLVTCTVFGITGVPAGWVLWYNVSKYTNPPRKRADNDATVA